MLRHKTYKYYHRLHIINSLNFSLHKLNTFELIHHSIMMLDNFCKLHMTANLAFGQDLVDLNKHKKQSKSTSTDIRCNLKLDQSKKYNHHSLLRSQLYKCICQEKTDHYTSLDRFCINMNRLMKGLRLLCHIVNIRLSLYITNKYLNIAYIHHLTKRSRQCIKDRHLLGYHSLHIESHHMVCPFLHHSFQQLLVYNLCCIKYTSFFECKLGM